MGLRVAAAVDEAPIDETFAALADHDADTAGALREELDAVLEGVRASAWPDVAWCASRVTPSGYPVELGFTGAGGQMRAIAEVAGPEVDPHERVIRALELAQPADLADIEPVLHAQRRATLRYGAWVGVRASPGRAATRKVYLEAPPGSFPSSPATVLNSIGVDAATGVVERYVRAHQMTQRRLTELLERVGVGGRESELVEAIDDCVSPSLRPGLSDAPAGFSVAASEVGTITAVHLPAWRLGGSDGDVRARLLSAAQHHGWDLGAYACASAPLAARHRGAPRAHGIVAWVLAPGRPVLLHVGLTPPSAVPQFHRPQRGMS